MAARPPKTSMIRRYWNLAHWTIGRAVLLLAIANIFIGFYLSHIAYAHIIAQAVVLGGLFIIYLLKDGIEYLQVRHTPAEEERLLAEMQHTGDPLLVTSQSVFAHHGLYKHTLAFCPLRFCPSWFWVICIFLSIPQVSL